MRLPKIFICCGIVLVCLVLTANTSIQAQIQNAPQGVGTTPELAEADRLSAEVVRLYQAGQFEEALSFAKRVLKLREKALDPNDLLLADSLTNVAEVYLALGKPLDAEPLLKRALAIQEKNPTSNSLLIGKTLDRLAAFRLASGDVKKAEEMYRRAIAAKEKALGPNHSEVALTLDSLADLYNKQKDYAQAIVLLQQVATLREKKYGKSNPDFGRSLERLACAMFRNNEKAEAEKVEARANEILYRDQAKKTEPFLMSPAMFECRIVNNPRPEFPGILAGRNGHYIVITAVEVDEAGSVVAASLVSGEPAFKKPAETAALKAKFRPALIDGRPAKFKGVLVHNYDIMLMRILVPGSSTRP
jgi:tetratricopeptide (TPR) repeat protein